MTEEEKARLAADLLNGLSPIMTGSFLLGLLVGAFFFSRFLDFIDRYLHRKEHKIKQNVEHQ